MDGLALTLALVCGLDAATDAARERLVLDVCVERAVPRRDWVADVVAECKRQGKAGDCRLHDYLAGDYYRAEVAWTVRHHFTTYWFFSQQLWYATRGQYGDRPGPGRFVGLTETVQKVGNTLTDAVARGVPGREE